MSTVHAQGEKTDSVASVAERSKKYYGLRFGVDLSKPIRSLIDEDYSGFEIVGDFRIRKNYYIAAELGNEKIASSLANIENTTSGSYLKAGFNYNVYENWYGMNNLIYVGLRGGFSTFSQELTSFTVYTDNTVFPDDIRPSAQDFGGLNATWLELKFGIEVEIFNNVYLGLDAQLKRSITATEPGNYRNLFFPGFGRVTEESTIGVGYGYRISYLIPLSKK